MNPLQRIFEVRDVLHEALNLKALVIYYEKPILVVKAPLGEETLWMDVQTTGWQTTAYITQANTKYARRTFYLSGINVRGWLGSNQINAQQSEGQYRPWIINEIHGRFHLRWKKQNDHVYLSEPLQPKQHQYKVFKDRSKTTRYDEPWTFAPLMSKPSRLGKQGPKYQTKEEAMWGAKDEALRQGQLPIRRKPGEPKILIWTSMWSEASEVHEARLDNGTIVRITTKRNKVTVDLIDPQNVSTKGRPPAVQWRQNQHKEIRTLVKYYINTAKGRN